MGRISLEEAKKNISIVEYLAEHGFFPVGMSGKRHRFKSVFREEKEASMFVEDELGLWNDFGQGGGSIIDLAMGIHGFSNIPKTLEHLTKFNRKFLRNPSKKLPNQSVLFDKQNSSLSNIRIQPLNHYVLLKYLKEVRGINEKIAKKYLRLVWYDNKQRKNLFAIGWVNDSGSFELRSAGKQNFKAITGKKDISTIINNADVKTAYIFEGMLDFLSALMMKNKMYLEGTVYILNTTSLVKRLIPQLEKNDFKLVHTFFDNDKGGREAENTLLSLYKNSSICRSQVFYEDFVDVNDYWVDFLKILP
ncbi:MAG: toprim domain-containing protein [Saprospiraceae bacterium]|mgnify:CR=1 FL=1